jgi:hypothetical protein
VPVIGIRERCIHDLALALPLRGSFTVDFGCADRVIGLGKIMYSTVLGLLRADGGVAPPWGASRSGLPTSQTEQAPPRGGLSPLALIQRNALVNSYPAPI